MRKYPKSGNKKLKTYDKWFSRYIRLRDTNKYGFGLCITCHRKCHFDALDAGHCFTRNNLSTRFDDKNVHAQCHNCNRFKGGESEAHKLRIAHRYGQETLDWLTKKTSSMMNLLPFEIKEGSDKYRELVRELYAQKSARFKEENQNLIT